MSDLKEKTSNMSRIAKIGGLAVLIIAVLAVGGAFAYDAAQKDQIAAGRARSAASTSAATARRGRGP